MIIFGGGKQC
uniref:Uncharacterized protein n=1 Tax=Rhizophora mucronata TaxID=61149 RepID=A0A2P2LK37_RHIMU